MPLTDHTCKLCSLHTHVDNMTVGSVCLEGEGPLTAEVLVLGIYPGLSEVTEGRPYFGESGKLLRAALLDIGLAEPSSDPQRPRFKNVRATNVVRCYSPDRDPTAVEVKACGIYLNSEIDAMPYLRVVIALGTIPMKVLGVSGSVTDLAGVPMRATVRGKELIVVPIMHPAGVIRRQTYLSTWQSHWHQIREIVSPRTESVASRLGARIYKQGLQGRDWRTA